MSVVMLVRGSGYLPYVVLVDGRAWGYFRRESAARRFLLAVSGMDPQYEHRFVRVTS